MDTRREGDQVERWQAFPSILGGPSLASSDPLVAHLGPGSFLRPYMADRADPLCADLAREHCGLSESPSGATSAQGERRRSDGRRSCGRHRSREGGGIGRLPGRDLASRLHRTFASARRGPHTESERPPFDGCTPRKRFSRKRVSIDLLLQGKTRASKAFGACLLQSVNLRLSAYSERDARIGGRPH
jgi:hypothetical protein